MCGFEILPDYPVATAVLGGVKRLIGKLDQNPMIYIPRGGQAGDPQADGDMGCRLRGSVGDPQAPNRIKYSAGDTAGPVRVRFRQQNGKFLASVACSQVRRAIDVGRQGARNGLQTSIPGLVAI